MLVYGDRREIADPRRDLDRLRDRLSVIPSGERGLARHAALTGALIDAGRLLQGVADAAFADGNSDRRTDATDALGAVAIEIGGAVSTSWKCRFAAPVPAIAVPPIADLPAEVELRTPEGFAFYAVYPEAFAEAARVLKLTGEPRVIGIRSIGASLGATVAAALDVPTFATVRPFGDPFARQICIGPDLEAELLSGDPHFVIVDEGPGMSGSSFGAVADWLEDRGVPLSRLAFLTSHDGPLGPKSSGRHRERWAKAQRIAADLAPRLPVLLEQWAAELLGPLDGPLIDLSGGAWRRWTHAREQEWPAASPLWERRKYLAFASGETWLLKFAGLGSEGARKLAIARRLYEHDLVPEPRGLIHGFLLERWHGDARRLDRGERPLAAIARYIAQRAGALGEFEGDGASLDQLLAMAERNLGSALDGAAADWAAQWRPRLAELQSQVRAFPTDSRMLPHEWLRLPDGRLLKADALDHHAAHDLVGCQDVAWDVAGAVAEFGLDLRETGNLLQLLARERVQVSRELLEFYHLAYAAFRIGQVSLALQSAPAGDEQRRLREQLLRYRSRAEQMLFDTRLGTDSPDILA